MEEKPAGDENTVFIGAKPFMKSNKLNLVWHAVT